MAVTGIALSLFVLVHMAGNLQVFLGAEAMDAYGAALKKLPPVLWGARLSLLAMAALHVVAFVALTRRSRAARPAGYRVTAHRESTFASRSMRLTGPLLLAFIVYHLLHFTTGTVHPNFHEGKVYANLVTGLRVVPVALFYLLAMACLALHLFHGIWSVFQTLGTSQPRAASFGGKLAALFTIVVVGGFAVIPVAVLTGLLK
jgi:succinate dehydrogenase / fumarate reductase cytochrome b subunit